MPVQTIASKAEFDALIKQKKFVIVQATATWCGPCKAITPMFNKHSDANENVAFARFDIDDVADLAQEFGIRSVPSFHSFVDGDSVDKVSGANPPALQKAVADLADKAKNSFSTQEDF